MKQTFAEWSTAFVNSLPDSSFAYVESGGTKDKSGKTVPRSKRHLPYKDENGKVDLPHVRNALARLSQTQIPESAKPAIRKKLQAILEKTKASTKHVGLLPLQFGEQVDGSEIPSKIHILPVGSWEHPAYGPISITPSDLQEFADNFNNGLRKGVPITAGHEGFSELPAQGWLTAVEPQPDGLWGDVDWTDLGKQTLSDKQFKFFSPEFYRDYKDPQTQRVHRNVLTGGALTKSPYFKELTALVASDSICFGFDDKNIDSDSTNSDMDLNTILTKDVSTLTDEETAYLREHESELSDEQKNTYASALEDVTDSTDETPKDTTAPATEDTTPATPATEPAAPAPATEAAPAAPVAASEKMMQIKASDFDLLKRQAADGAKAFSELEAKKIDESVSKMIFSEGNSAGRFLVKSKDTLTTFVKSLNDSQRTAFSELVAQLPSQGTAQMFSEVGDGGFTEGGAAAEVKVKVDQIMKANDKLATGEAYRQVFAENPELAARYDAEINGIG